MAAMLSDMTYATQFQLLRVWIGSLGPHHLESSSVLAGWSVGDLIGHLIGTASTIASLEPAPAGAEPIGVAAYVSQYAASSEQIAGIARQTSESAGVELLDRMDEAEAAAEQNLGRLGAFDTVVLSRRGPILLSDFLDTRLIELVVHAGDLGRSLPDHPAPHVLPSATRRVVAVLRELLTARADDPVRALAAASALPVGEFIELAAGRRAPTAELSAALTRALPLF